MATTSGTGGVATSTPPKTTPKVVNALPGTASTVKTQGQTFNAPDTSAETSTLHTDANDTGADLNGDGTPDAGYPRRLKFGELSQYGVAQLSNADGLPDLN